MFKIYLHRKVSQFHCYVSVEYLEIQAALQHLPVLHCPCVSCVRAGPGLLMAAATACSTSALLLTELCGAAIMAFRKPNWWQYFKNFYKISTRI